MVGIPSGLFGGDESSFWISARLPFFKILVKHEISSGVKRPDFAGPSSHKKEARLMVR